MYANACVCMCVHVRVIVCVYEHGRLWKQCADVCVACVCMSAEELTLTPLLKAAPAEEKEQFLLRKQAVSFCFPALGGPLQSRLPWGR